MNNYKIKSLLYVEDEADTKEELKDILMDFCEELYFASNGKEGLELFKKYKPELIISDIKMPLMNGIEMVKHIKNIDKNVKVIFTTAFSDTNYFLDSIELQVEGYILKPIRLKKLIDSIETIVRSINLEKELNRKNELINEQSNKLLNVQKIAKLGYWIYDIVNDLVEWSNEVYEIFEIDKNEFTPTFENFIKYIHPEDKESVIDKYKTFFELKKIYEIKYRIITKSGKVKWIFKNCYTVDEEGEKVIFSGMIQDITELMSAQLKAIELEKIKSEFFVNISHEIRTPLTAIIGMTDILLEKKDISIENLENLNVIKDTSNLLINTINDILDFSALQSGKYKINEKSFNLNNLVNQLKKIMDIQLRKKEVKFKVDVDTQLPKNLISDQFRIEQILLNLLSNSIKFTYDGYIKLKIYLDSINEEYINICFEVEDSGIGMDENFQKDLFKAFTQGRNSNTRNNKGTGLGLVITKKFVELMNGEISFFSQKNSGSTFKIKLPLKVSKDNIVLEETFMKLKEPKKALLVEDDKINQIVLSKTLSKIGFEVECSDDGIEAINSVKENFYDIIFMDIHMPNLDGLEATKEIRKFNNDIPIIALSAGILGEDINRSLNSGMNDHISKPLIIEQVNKVLSKYFIPNYF